MVARLGSGASSYIIILSDMTSTMVPMILFSVFSIIASICVLFLPETRDQPLPDTLNVSCVVIHAYPQCHAQDAVTFLRVDKAQCMPIGRGGHRAKTVCESNATSPQRPGSPSRTRNDTYQSSRMVWDYSV
jgi:hypothetical protein